MLVYTRFQVIATTLLAVQSFLPLGCAKGTSPAPVTAASPDHAPPPDDEILSLPTTTFPPPVQEHLARLCRDALGPHPFKIYKTCRHEASGWVYCYLRETISPHSVGVLAEVDPEMKRVVRFKSEWGQWVERKPLDK